MSRTTTLFLCGDVMTGRGVDQIQRHSVAPELHEPFVKNAMDYVRLAERRNGPVPRPVAPDYFWGDALGAWEAFRPELRIINLETGITTSDEFWPSKGIHYRMHPGNVDCLNAAGVHGCTLANNHVLDFGRPGLTETLSTLQSAGIAAVGAGIDEAAATAPAAFPLAGGGRVLLFGCCHGSSGVPAAWAASGGRSGVHRLPDLSPRTARRYAERLLAHREPGDIVLVSVHWGGNWGYDVPDSQRGFARILVDSGAADIVHGHSSHHPKGLEQYRGRLILYGCGDFLNDYEGIGGYEEYRSWLSLMFFVTVAADSGETVDLTMVPLQMRRLRLVAADEADRAWLAGRLHEASREFGTAVGLEDGKLKLLRS